MPSAGLRKICPYCASPDVQVDANGGGLCNACHKRTKAVLEMKWSKVSDYKRTLAEHEKHRHFSIYRCDEVHAVMLVLLTALLLAFFIYLS